MASTLVRLGAKIIVWSSVVDAPTHILDDEDDVRAWTKEEYGGFGLRELPARLERLRAKGTSSLIYESAEDAVSGNRAGKGETELTFEQLVAYYGVDREDYDDPPEGIRRGDDDDEPKDQP